MKTDDTIQHTRRLQHEMLKRSSHAVKRGEGPSRRLMWAICVAVVGVAALMAYSRDELTAHASSSSGNAFAPTVATHSHAPADAPEGMVWIPGGEFSMGANDPPDMDEVGMRSTQDARPIHRVYVDGFFMDKTDVTNAQFAKFVKATNYVTVAERKPRAEDFPGAPPENLVAGAVVFSPPDHPVSLDDHFQWWVTSTERTGAIRWVPPAISKGRVITR